MKVKLKSLARKREKISAKPTPIDAPSYPRIDLDSREMPEIAGLKFGDEVHLHLHGKVDSRSMSDWDGKPTHRASIKLLKGAIQHPKVLHNTTEAIDSASKEAGGLGRIVSDFESMSGMKA
jgi:hypothetical protein